MRVFHGSDVWIEDVDLAKGYDYRDFGKGFYVTKFRNHAHLRAINIAKNHGTRPIVTEFEYLEIHPINVGLSVKKFESISPEWVEFIIMNRDPSLTHPAHAYDIVEGPIANDWITRQVQRYTKGIISMERLMEKLTYREPTHQICFCTPESLLSLELRENFDTRFAIEDISDFLVESLIHDSQLSEEQAINILFSSDVYRQLWEAELYKQPWDDIYKILKTEINK